MEPREKEQFERIETEIESKGKGYLLVRRCPVEEMPALIEREVKILRTRGAHRIFVSSVDPNAPIQKDTQELIGLVYAHDMLGMKTSLEGRTKPERQLALSPLTREQGSMWLRLYNESFWSVPNSATYGEEELEQLLTDQYRCGFALAQGEIVGIYELGFKKENPEIGSIGIQSQKRGRGLGRALLLTLMDELAELGYSKCWLQVSTANTNAYQLYQEVGFTLDRILSSWFEAVP